MFESTGILNEGLFKELSKYVISPKQRKFLLISSIIFGLLGVVFSSLGILSSSIYFVLFGDCLNDNQLNVFEKFIKEKFRNIK